MYEERYKPERMASECFCFYFIRKNQLSRHFLNEWRVRKMAERKSDDVVASSPPCSCQKERSGHSHVTPLLRDSVNLVSSSPSPSATHSPPLPLNFSFRRLLGLHFCFSLLLLFAFVLGIFRPRRAKLRMIKSSVARAQRRIRLRSVS